MTDHPTHEPAPDRPEQPREPQPPWGAPEQQGGSAPGQQWPAQGSSPAPQGWGQGSQGSQSGPGYGQGYGPGQGYAQQYGQGWGQGGQQQGGYGYGHPGHGGYAYGGWPQGGPVRDPDARPATVTAAAVLTFVFSGLGLLLFGVAFIGLAAGGDAVLEQIRQQPGLETSGFDAEDLVGLALGIVGVLALWCVLASVLAVLALRRSQAGRIGLAVSAGLSALVCLAGIGSLVTVLPLAASVAAVVCLFTGGANDWYARRTPQHAGGQPHDPRQWSQQSGAAAGPTATWGQPGPGGQPSQPGQPTYPTYPTGPTTPAGTEQDRPGPTGHDGPDDDRPVQRPWG